MVSIEYNEFLKKVEFCGLRVKEASFSTSDDFFNVDGDKELKKKLDFGVLNICQDVDEETFSADVFFQVGIKQSKKILFKVRSVYQIIFLKFDCATSEADVAKFCNTTIKATIFPYFRHSYNQVCLDAHVDLPPLPMLKIVPKVGVLAD